MRDGRSTCPYRWNNHSRAVHAWNFATKVALVAAILSTTPNAPTPAKADASRFRAAGNAAA
jgi:hypothetical protein